MTAFVVIIAVVVALVALMWALYHGEKTLPDTDQQAPVSIEGENHQ